PRTPTGAGTTCECVRAAAIAVDDPDVRRTVALPDDICDPLAVRGTGRVIRALIREIGEHREVSAVGLDRVDVPRRFAESGEGDPAIRDCSSRTLRMLRTAET